MTSTTSANRTPPSKEVVAAAEGKTVRDVIQVGLDVLFCGINPSLYSAATGHHFARPGNRFWRALHGAAMTDELLSPFDDRRLLDFGIGITNLVARATVKAADLSSNELEEGARRLERKVRRYRPHVLAILGVQAYATAFGHRASLGQQSSTIGGAVVFVLPNPSGLQARYQLPELVACFKQLVVAACLQSSP